MGTKKIVLLRHGESQWNKENRFTGWVDVDLSEKGVKEARTAGQLLKAEKFEFDHAYTSILKRAIRTLWYVLDESDCMWLPVSKTWRLNERHYGALQGLNKSETVKKYGEQQVHIWRRSYDIPPPPFDDSAHQAQLREPRLANITANLVPRTEALKQTLERVMPYWKEELWPRVSRGDRLLIVAHGNSIRALVKHLDQIPDEDIAELNIPTGIPLVYELDDLGRAQTHYYLGDQDAAEKAAEAVKQQTKA